MSEIFFVNLGNIIHADKSIPKQRHGLSRGRFRAFRQESGCSL